MQHAVCMLRKKTWPLPLADFQLMANISLFIKALHIRTTHTFFGSRTAGRRRQLKEHLVTANLMLEKFDVVGTLSEYTHCKIHTIWTGIPSSTRTLHNSGQCTRSNAFDKSNEEYANSTFFLCPVTNGDARTEGRDGKYAFNLVGGPNLLDLRIADDILILAHSRVEAGNFLDALVKQLDRVGLLLNPETTMVIMNEAQPPADIERQECSIVTRLRLLWACISATLHWRTPR